MVDVVVEDHIMRIVLRRPEAMNALDRPAFAALDRALRTTAADPDIAAVVLTGDGGTFCAGQDLGELQEIDPGELAHHPFHAFIEALAYHPAPVLAAVEGKAVGAGLTMLLHCDIVVASEDARFKMPFVALGSTAEAGSSAALADLVGPARANRMLLLGEWVDGPAALTCGLVSELTPAGGAMTAAMGHAEHLVRQPRASVLASKKLLVEARRERVAAALAREKQVLLGLYQGAQIRESAASFTSGRSQSAMPTRSSTDASVVPGVG